MLFKIRVADRETGEESVIEIVAPTVQLARAEANEAGYLVSRIEPAAVTAKTQEGEAAPTPMASSTQPAQHRAGHPDAALTIGAIFGLVLGAIIGHSLAGPLGITAGGLCGILPGLGIGVALRSRSEGSKLSALARLAVAGIPLGIAVAMFFGFCIVPLNWWNGLSTPDSKENSGASAPAYDTDNHRDADEVLRAVGEDPNKVPARDRAELQRSIQNLADTSGRSKKYAPSSLDRARNYARSEYERNKKIMSESDARRQYEKDLANVAQEARDKGVP